MNTIKKVSLISLAVGLIPFLALAQSDIVPVTVPPNVGLGRLIDSILNFFFGLFLAIAALFIIYAAYLYLTSGGDAEKLTTAKNVIIYAVVAIIVAFISRTIVAVVRNVLGT